MSNEPNKPISADELKEKELEGVVGGQVQVGQIDLEMRHPDNGRFIQT